MPNPPDPPRRVNAPYFSGDLDWGQTAIFWLGQNEQGDPPTRNYADVRVGYTADALKIQVTTVDYYLWYDENASSSSDLTRSPTPWPWWVAARCSPSPTTCRPARVRP